MYCPERENEFVQCVINVTVRIYTYTCPLLTIERGRRVPIQSPRFQQLYVHACMQRENMYNMTYVYTMTARCTSTGTHELHVLTATFFLVFFLPRERERCMDHWIRTVRRRSLTLHHLSGARACSSHRVPAAAATPGPPVHCWPPIDDHARMYCYHRSLWGVPRFR